MSLPHRAAVRGAEVTARGGAVSRVWGRELALSFPDLYLLILIDAHYCNTKCK